MEKGRKAVLLACNSQTETTTYFAHSYNDPDTLLSDNLINAHIPFDFPIPQLNIELDDESFENKLYGILQ